MFFYLELQVYNHQANYQNHCLTKKGLPKILDKCTFPLTGKNVVDRIYTNLAILDVNKEGLFVKELADNISFEYLKSKTEANLFQY